MRLVVAGLMVTSLLAVSLMPAAAACRISMRDPTNPYWSEDCFKIPDTEDATSQETHVKVHTKSLIGSLPVAPDCSDVPCVDVINANLSVDLNDNEDPLAMNLTATSNDESREAVFESGPCGATLVLPGDVSLRFDDCVL